MTKLKRRGLLQIVGAVTVLPTLPALDGCAGREDKGFLDARERTALTLLVDLVLPADEATPSASALGVVDYIDRLLTGAGLIFGSGPFSGRTPFPDEHGQASAVFPPNDFAIAEPLDRVQRAAWRALLFGGPSPAGDDAGLRARMRVGLAGITAATTLTDLEEPFLDLIVQLTGEGAFAAPEYGGNRNGAGWRLCNYEGDAQPFGFSNFDEVASVYRERPDAPVSTADVKPDPDPLDDEVRALLGQAVALLGGRENPS